MAHGTHCHCMMCSVGKKVGMIEHEEKHEHKHDEKHACPHCGDKSGTCNCG